MSMVFLKGVPSVLFAALFLAAAVLSRGLAFDPSPAFALVWLSVGGLAFAASRALREQRLADLSAARPVSAER